MKKKVLFTATVDSHILNFHIPYLKYFHDQGYEVHVATNENEEIPYCDKKIVIPFERSPFKLNNLKSIKLLKKVIMEEKYDIIHTHTPMGSVVTRLAAAKARKKYHTRVIYTAHGFHFYKGAPKKNWLVFYPVEKILSKITDTLITINSEDYNLAKNKFWCKDVQYVPGIGIDENKFSIKMTKKEKSELRKSLGLKDDDFVMIYVARLDKNKNQGFLIEVTRELIKTNPNVHLLLVGPDEYNGKYQEQAKDILSNVHFTGIRKDIPELLNISNIAVSSSLREGLPVNIMEALTARLPIVAINTRGVRDLITDGEDGYIVNECNINEFTKKINNIAQKKCLLKKNTHKKEYMLENVIDLMAKIYNKRKKVLHVLSSDKFSGAENVACTIIQNMSDKCEMAYCSPIGPIEKILKKKNIKYYGIKKLNYRNLKKIINEFKPDIIHAHDYRTSFYSSLFWKKSKIISHLHNNWPFAKKWNKKSIIYSLSINKFCKIIGVSNKIYDEAIFKNKMKDNFIVLYNFVDKNEILEKATEYKCKEYFDYYFFGRLTEQKNPKLFIDIIEKLVKSNKNSRACIIGDGELKEECNNIILQKNLEKNIKMFGFLENPFPIINNCKICIMPSTWEGFGLTAVESIVLGKKVFNSGIGGLGEIFKDNKEFICKTKNDYVRKIYKSASTNKNVNINRFVNKELYITKISDIYDL